MYHIILSSLTCPILGIPVPSYDPYEKQDGRRHRTIDAIYHVRETAVAMDLIDQLSTYIYRYVDNDQNKIFL